MNKRPGHVVVTTEVAFCSFCGRPRTLRNEAHQLGTLVRTLVTCETCHRTLSSTIGIASAETAEPAEAAAAQPVAVEAEAEAPPAPKAPAKRKAAAAKAAAPKSRATKKPQ